MAIKAAATLKPNGSFAIAEAEDVSCYVTTTYEDDDGNYQQETIQTDVQQALNYLNSGLDRLNNSIANVGVLSYSTILNVSEGTTYDEIDIPACVSLRIYMNNTYGKKATTLDMTSLLANRPSLVTAVFTGDVYNLPDGHNVKMDGMFENCYALTSVVFKEDNIDLDYPIHYASSTSHMFSRCYSLQSINRLNENTFSLVTDASHMFSWCTSLASLTLPEGAFPLVTDTSYMFYDCTSLASLTLPEGAFPLVTDASYMFCDCDSLASLTLPEGAFPLVTNASYMFRGCTSLTSLTLPEGAFPLVTDASYMFCYCDSLTSLTLPEGAFPLVTDASYMFGWCDSLTSLTLPEGAFPLVTKASYMFSRCKALTSIRNLTLSGLALKSDYMTSYAFSSVAKAIFELNSALTDCLLTGTLYKSGVSLAGAPNLNAESLYSWFAALYNWTTNPESKTTDDKTHTLTLTTDQVSRLQDYTGEGGESGADAYQTALDRGWTIANS